MVNTEKTDKHLIQACDEAKERLNKEGMDEITGATSFYDEVLVWLENYGQKHLEKEKCLSCRLSYWTILEEGCTKGGKTTKNKHEYYDGLIKLISFKKFINDN